VLCVDLKHVSKSKQSGQQSHLQCKSIHNLLILNDSSNTYLVVSYTTRLLTARIACDSTRTRTNGLSPPPHPLISQRYLFLIKNP
jgi:hypothetical protein